MKTKKILLLVTLVVVLVGVVSASEVSDDTINANTHDTEDMLVQELAPATAEIQESVTSEAKENKEIQKEEKTIKTISIIAWDTGDIGVVNPNANANGYSAGSAGSVANFVGPGNADTQNTNSHNGTTTDSNGNGENSGNSNSEDSKNNIFDLGIVNTKTYTVNDFDTLHNALTSDTYSTVTVNIKSNIKLTCYTELSQAIKTLTINGNGKTINGNNSYQFLTIDSDSTVTIKNIKIINCYTEEDGGAIHNEQGTLTITNSTLNNNTAWFGGAISNYAILTINNSTLNNNTADHGGAISNTAKLEINNSTLNNNTVTYAGGAIVNLAALTINNSTLNNNTADYGGAIENDANPFGGAMSTYGTLTINNSTLNNNTATYAGGAIENNATLTINNSTLNNNTADHGGAISNTAKLEINNSQFKYNIAEFGNGGAIENKATLTINNSTLNNNTATYTGGAIYNRDNANMTMNNTTLNNNTANCGGAISNYAILTINNSTLNNNYAYDWGGAVYNNAILTINNSTLNNNKADYGGAIFNRVNITINSCTLNYNKAEDNGGAIYIESTGYLYIQNNTLKYSINIENNTFSKNNAENGAGIYVYSDEYDCKELKTRWVEGHYESGSYYDIYGVEVHYNKWVEGHYEEYYVPISNISNPFIKIQKNIFRQNKANTTGKAIIKYKNATISNNTNAETSKYSGTIYINWPNVQIKNNIFYDEIIYTKTITSAVNGIIGEKLTLKATVTDTYNNKVNEGNLIFKLNGITIKYNGKLTGSSNPLIAKVTNGVATATITPDLNMRNIKKLTAHYTGTDSYNASVSVPVTSQISQRNASIVVTSNVKTIKQGQVLTLTAKIYDTTNGKKSTNLTKYADEFVYFKVNGITLKDSNGITLKDSNGITLKDSNGKMLKVKIINGTATTKYTIPLGLSGITDGKTMTPKNHTILAGFYNKNYQENIRNTSTFQVERSNITITIANATVNNKTHKLSLTATIKDYLGNIVAGPNKCVIKINDMSLKNGTQAMYYYSTNGILNIKDTHIPAYNNYKTIEIVTQDRLAYKSQRNTTTNIKVENKNVKTATVEKNVERNIKTASKTYDVNDFNTLHSALTSDTYDTVTVNVKSNIKLTNDTTVNEAIKTLTINGNGKTVNGNNEYRFLNITSNSIVTLNNIEITQCYASPAYNTDDFLGDWETCFGGAIYNNGTVIINNSTLKNNRATGSATGVRTFSDGGAIYNNGNLTIINSTLNDNTAIGGDYSQGGAINNIGNLTIINSKLNNNTAWFGGAISNYAILTINNSTLNNNTATIYGGAIFNCGGNLSVTNNILTNNIALNDGGAIYNDKGNITIKKSILINNSADFGGAIYNSKLNIMIENGGNITIKESILINNSAEQGGAIYNFKGRVSIKNSTLDNNIAYDGGAIFNWYSTLNIIDTQLNNNTAYQIGGAINNIYWSTLTLNNCALNNNIADTGGAIYNDGDCDNVTSINKCYFTQNVANNGSAIYNSRNLIIKESTMNNNTAKENGGAIFNCGGNLSATNNILTNNIALNNGGAIYNEYDSTMYVENNSLKSTNIENNTFYKNNATNGSAIYNYVSISDYQERIPRWVENHYEYEYVPISKITIPIIKIQKNVFKENKAKTTGKAIISSRNITIKNNINDNKSIYSSTIHNEGDTIIITNNTFDDGIINTKLTVSTVYAVIGNPMTLTAQVTYSNNKAVTNGYVIFKLNGITIKDNGKLTGSNNPLKVYVNNGVASTTVTADLNMRYAQNLTAVYSGSSTYNASRSNNAKAQISQRNASIVVNSNVKTIKQGQTLTITARVYDTTGGKRSTSLIPYEDEFVYFKVNGITLKDSKGNMQKVKVVNGTATIKYTIPLGLSGVTDGKTFNVKNHTILAGYYNKNYQAEVRNTSTFQVERSNITITIANATVNNKTHKLSLTATIKDYLGNIVAGPNKCVIKINGISLKNGTQAMYYYSTNGILNIKDINIPAYNNYKTIEIVTQDRLAYKSQRNTTTVIKVTN